MGGGPKTCWAVWLLGKKLLPLWIACKKWPGPSRTAGSGAHWQHSRVEGRQQRSMAITWDEWKTILTGGYGGDLGHGHLQFSKDDFVFFLEVGYIQSWANHGQQPPAM